MSELRSVVESLRAEVLSELPDARVEEDFTELHAAMEQLETERLRRLGEIDARRLFQRDGYLSCVSWLASRFKMAWGSARDQVRSARALQEMPGTRRALTDGGVSMAGMRLLVAARRFDPEVFERDEALLVEAARIHPIPDLRKVVAHWQQRVEDARHVLGEGRLRQRRSLHASVSYEGMVRVDGDLDPETGETLLSALGAVLDAEAHSRTQEDVRTPAQRRADALGEICRQWLDRGDRPSVGGEHPHVTLTVDIDALRARAEAATGVGAETQATVGAEAGAGAPALVLRGPKLDHAGPVDIDTALRLSCDASVMRVVLSGASQPLDVGRRTPVVPAALRRAVIVRDEHCQFPGCDRPPSFYDVHHVKHWGRGGPTALWNLMLLCRRHHRLIHDHGGFTLELVRGHPVFARPDGSVLVQDRAPP